MEEEKQKTKPLEQVESIKTRCPDFDEDCKDIDKLGCYLGGFSRCANGVLGFTERAEGFCPYLNHDN